MRSADWGFKVFGRYTCNCTFVGLSYRWGEWTISNSFVGDNVLLVQEARSKSELQGAAIGIGTGAEFDLMCDFGLFGDCNLLGVIAEQTLKDVFQSGTMGFSGGSAVRYPSETCILPEADFRIGINYSWSCDCINLVAELGYEVDYFWDPDCHPLFPL